MSLKSVENKQKNLFRTGRLIFNPPQKFCFCW